MASSRNGGDIRVFAALAAKTRISEELKDFGKDPKSVAFDAKTR